ncbi:MAG: CBS domain-containing protein [Patescibacteria group bacterium]|nr:CBS domain-containing protein [Patescibacteria group bacterium]
MKVRDVFQKKVGYITPNSTLHEASRYIFGHNHKGLPVVEGKKKKLVGFITEQDITSQLFPSIQELVEDYVHERDFEVMEQRVKEVLTKKVKDVMSRKVILIHVDEPLLKAESIMQLKDISRLPVINSKGHLIGIISKGDIFRALVSPKIRGFK